MDANVLSATTKNRAGHVAQLMAARPSQVRRIAVKEERRVLGHASDE